LYQPGVGIKENFSSKFYPFILTLSNYDFSENINISGNLNDNPTINFTNTWSQDFPGITYIPIKNTVCRFKKLPSKTKDQSPHLLMPNIVLDQINIPVDVLLKNYVIYDYIGNQLLSGTTRNIDIHSLHSGPYILVLQHHSGVHTHKFIKI
jgi:hypothetical protein